MVRTIRMMILATFASLVFVGHERGVFANSWVRDDCPSACWVIGFDCEGAVDCGSVDDNLCTDLCQAFASPTYCNQNWGEGFAAGCTQGVSFSCACAPAG